MKNFLIICFVVCGFFTHINAQKARSDSSSFWTLDRCLKPNSSLVDFYYGFPNLFALIAKATIVSSDIQGVTVSSLGGIGGKYEFLLTEDFGICGEFNYSNITIAYTEQGSSAGRLYHYNWDLPAIRAMVGANYHFVNTERFEAYVAGKIGYYQRKIILTTDDPQYIIPKFGIPLSFAAIRAEVGMRYFFLDFLGVHANFGIGGGPLFMVGLCGTF